MLAIQPLKYVDPNNFTVTERLDLIQGNGGTYYVQVVDDGVRNVLPAGSTVQIVFPRMLTIQATPVNQDVTVSCTIADARDASVYRFDLTVTNVNAIVSEGVKLLITTSGVTKTYPVDHLVRRRSNVPGA